MSSISLCSDGMEFRRYKEAKLAKTIIGDIMAEAEKAIDTTGKLES
ncbi:MAG: hypothetical protein H8E40_12785 [Chloroflexi bacterium]|nr:hypothetical protein [Chloroflexota bacterium]